MGRWSIAASRFEEVASWRANFPDLVEGLGIRDTGLGFRIQGLGFLGRSVWGFWAVAFGVWGFRIWG